MHDAKNLFGRDWQPDWFKADLKAGKDLGDFAVYGVLQPFIYSKHHRDADQTPLYSLP